MNTLAVIALLLVIPALQVQGGAIGVTNPPTGPPKGPPADPPTNPPTGPPTDQRPGPPPPSDRFDPQGFFKFMKEQAKHALGFAKDFKDLGGILEKLDMSALEKKQKEMEQADHVFEGTEHFLLSALSSLFKKPEGDGPPPMCGSLAGYLKRSHEEGKPIEQMEAVGLMADDFGCIGEKIEKIFEKFEEAAQGPSNADDEMEVILRTVARINAIHHTTERFLRAVDAAFPKPEVEEEEEEEDSDSTRRQLNNELLKLLLKRVLDNGPAAKRGVRSLLPILNEKYRK